jgi:hypothetical protein
MATSTLVAITRLVVVTVVLVVNELVTPAIFVVEPKVTVEFVVETRLDDVPKVKVLSSEVE